MSGMSIWIAASKGRESWRPQGQYRVRQGSVGGRQASVPGGHRRYGTARTCAGPLTGPLPTDACRLTTEHAVLSDRPGRSDAVCESASLCAQQIGSHRRAFLRRT